MTSFVPWKKTKRDIDPAILNESDPLLIDQSDIGDALSRYNAWLADAWVEGSRAYTDRRDPACFFVPERSLKEYFRAGHNLQELCQELYSPRGLPDGFDPQSILHGYELAFATLLHIRHGPLIARFVLYDELNDQKLPFDARPKVFPRISGDDNDKLFQHFSRSQHSFKVPELRYQTIFNHGADRILPYRRVEQLGIGQGHTSDVWKIEVVPGYNSLETRLPRNQNHDGALRNVYVLKVFKTQWAERDWKQELNAFLNLGKNERTENNLIACFGSFRHGSSVSLLLEYADRNTLEELFQGVKPSGALEILDVWKGLLDLTKALQHLHGNHHLREKFGQKLAGNATYKGVHQDVKPQNILVFSKKNGSRFELIFKLADLGSSHFKPKQQSSSAIGRKWAATMNFGQRGTRTYGPPELYMHGSMTSRVVEDPSIADVWSLGAIYSEAATWAVLGSDGLQIYRDQLERATKALDIEDAGCFHNGQEALSTVRSQHEIILDKTEEGDKITEAVIEIIDRMLYRESSRCTAAAASMDAQRALSKATRTARTGSVTQQDQRGRHLHNDTLAPPPLPPRARSQNAADTSPSSTPEPKTIGQDESGPYLQILLGPPRRRATTASSGVPRIDPSAVFRDSSTTGITIPRRPVISHAKVPASSPPLLSPSYTPPSLGASNTKAEKRLGSIQGRLRRISIPRSPFKSREASPRPDIGASGSLQKASSAPIPPDDVFGDSEDSEPRTSADSTTMFDYFDSSEKPEKHPSSTYKTHSRSLAHPQRLRLPFWKAQKAITWNKDRKQEKKDQPKSPFKKSKSELEEVPFLYERSHLHERDIIFLIDTAGIMEPHWDDMIALLGVLSHLLKKADTGGMTVYFTQSRDGEPLRPKSFKKTTSLVQWLEENRPRHNHQYAADVGRILSKLLDKYRDSLPDPQNWLDTAKKSFTTSKKTIVYVITDGRWQQPKAAQLAIEHLTDRLHELEEPEDQYGIQFIQVGDDPDGTENLKSYDRCEGLQRDVVDRELATGNIWKMLLGSINRTYDSDAESDEDEPGAVKIPLKGKERESGPDGDDENSNDSDDDYEEAQEMP